jgi:mannose-6-phosphate isomerase-like protein (cupin superfamily)
MRVMTLPPEWDGYRNHAHGASTEEAGQEEVYIPIGGSAMLHAGDATFELRPGVMIRVGPTQRRKIVPGPEGVRFIALGGLVGAHRASPWTELGGPWPLPQDT